MISLNILFENIEFMLILPPVTLSRLRLLIGEE